MEVFEAAAQACKNGVPSALATVIRTAGSTPRSEGARMLVYADGSIIGTIGGGALEKKVISIAQSCIADQRSERYSSKLDVDMGMRCAGDMEIYIEALQVCTPLYIFGAGHVAQALVPLLINLSYRVWVIDDRPNLLSKIRFPKAILKLIDPLRFVDETCFSAQSHLILMTHLHERDSDLLSLVLPKPHAWVGMLGSDRKVSVIKQKLRTQGFTQQQLAQVHAPIGVEIEAQTPHEIAISIAAELIAFRRNARFPIMPKSSVP